MQKLKVKQLDGVVSPAVSDDWSKLTENLATAAATSEKIDNAVSDAMGGALQSVTGGSAESGKYVSAVTKEGTPMIERRQGLLDRSKTIWAMVFPNDYEQVAQ